MLQFRTLQHLLSASTSPLGSRVIWMSSLEASPKFYSPEDWQLKKTGHSYEGTKYQIDLLATYLDHSSLRDTPPDSIPIRHFVSQPGVCSTNVSNALAGPVLNVLKVVLFYLVRNLFANTRCSYSERLDIGPLVRLTVSHDHSLQSGYCGRSPFPCSLGFRHLLLAFFHGLWE